MNQEKRAERVTALASQRDQQEAFASIHDPVVRNTAQRLCESLCLATGEPWGRMRIVVMRVLEQPVKSLTYLEQWGVKVDAAKAKEVTEGCAPKENEKPEQYAARKFTAARTLLAEATAQLEEQLDEDDDEKTEADSDG